MFEKGGGEDLHQSPGFVTCLHYNFHRARARANFHRTRARAITSIELELEQNHTVRVRKGGGEDFHQSPGFVTCLHYNFHRARARAIYVAQGGREATAIPVVYRSNDNVT